MCILLCKRGWGGGELKIVDYKHSVWSIAYRVFSIAGKSKIVSFGGLQLLISGRQRYTTFTYLICISAFWHMKSFAFSYIFGIVLTISSPFS